MQYWQTDQVMCRDAPVLTEQHTNNNATVKIYQRSTQAPVLILCLRPSVFKVLYTDFCQLCPYREHCVLAGIICS